MLIQSGPKDDQKTINIEIYDDCKDVGVFFSSGTDSSILLYLLAKENLETKKNIITFTIPKHDGAALYCNPIVDYINNELKTNVPYPILIGDPDLHHSMILPMAMRKALSQYPSLRLYVGENQNPPEPVKMPGVYPNRILKSPNRKITRPFNHLYKYHIIDLYYQFNQTDLLKLTHTCTERQVGRCNECFQCHERQWAFDVLQQIDPGTA